MLSKSHKTYLLKLYIYIFIYFQEAISFVDVSPTDALVTPGLGDTFNEYMKDVISKFFFKKKHLILLNPPKIEKIYL